MPDSCKRFADTGLRSLLGKMMLLVAACVVSVSTFAQLPELQSAALGGSTSARFFGGVSADEGLSYGDSFASDVVLDVLTEVQVESGHVGTAGNLYVIIVLDGTYFMALQSGQLAVWNLSAATLQPLSAGVTFAASEALPIVRGLAFGPAGISSASLQIFLAYDTTAEPGELFYTATPLSFSITPVVAEAQSLTLYKASLSGPVVQNLCLTCHVANGVASPFTDLLYVNSQQANYQTVNYNTLVNYIRSGGGSALLDNPSGAAPHTGGTLLPAGSAGFTNLSQFVDLVLSESQ